MPTTGLAGHIFQTLRTALRRLLAWFAVTGLIAAVVVELVSIIASGGSLPSLSTHLAAVALAIAVGYGVALTLFAIDVFHLLASIVASLEQDIETGAIGGMHYAERLVRDLEVHERRA